MDKDMPLDADTLELQVPGHVKAVLDERMIRLKDVKKVIIQGENTGKKIMNGTSGHLISHLVIGNITCWAEYSEQGDTFVLHNAYFHRVQIGEE